MAIKHTVNPEVECDSLCEKPGMGVTVIVKVDTRGRRLMRCCEKL
jgi:hypothetical protein